MNDPILESMCSKPMTFMGAPFSHDLSAAKAAILGLPFDCGIHPFRIGSRQGPRAIREQSRLIRPYNPELSDFDPIDRLGLVDCGDVVLTPGVLPEAFERIEDAMRVLVDANVVPLTMGGDGSVSHSQLKVLGEQHDGLIALHFDSHTDTTPPTAASPYNAGTQFHHASTRGWIDVSRSFHMGLRGTTMLPGGFARTRALGYRNLITMNDIQSRGIADVMNEVREAVTDRPVYLCLDMDVFDPSCAPGVCAPSWGGLTAREGLSILRQMSGINIVAVDVNTVSPPHDVNGMTSFLASALLYEALVLLCRLRGVDFPYELPASGQDQSA